MPPCRPRINPKRYSRPICALESKLKKSAARSPKLPEPSGRPKRCVTRNAPLNRGSRSVVGSAEIVKSGCNASRFWSGSRSREAGGAGCAACCACRTAGDVNTPAQIAVTVSIRASLITMLLVVFRADLDPAPDDADLAVGQIRAAGSGHPFTDDPGCAEQLVQDVAVLWIAGDDTDRARFAAADDADEIGVRNVMPQVHPAAWSASDVAVALRARRASRRIGRLEDFALNAGEGRLQVRRRACN